MLSSRNRLPDVLRPPGIGVENHVENKPVMGGQGTTQPPKKAFQFPAVGFKDYRLQYMLLKKN